MNIKVHKIVEVEKNKKFSLNNNKTLYISKQLKLDEEISKYYCICCLSNEQKDAKDMLLHKLNYINGVHFSIFLYRFNSNY